MLRYLLWEKTIDKIDCFCSLSFPNFEFYGFFNEFNLLIKSVIFEMLTVLFHDTFYHGLIHFVNPLTIIIGDFNA